MASHDTVIKGATVVDGTGAPPLRADVAIDGAVVTAVGDDVGSGRREVDASGLHLLPGWVDIHTHYDGQVTWDPEVTPSSWHGVTTVVMGNCGVGFAPVRPGAEGFLIELMEGVEDIPGTALHEGIEWRWESFPEYLDALESQPRVLDVATQVPHAAVRAYVMGERAHDDATAEDVAAMARLVREGLAAGAAGFSTSRTALHRSKHGLVPGTLAPADELLAIAEAMSDVGHGVFQVVSDRAMVEPERSWMLDIAGRLGIPVTYPMGVAVSDADGARRGLAELEDLVEQGMKLLPQVASRPVGMMFGLQSSLHPFITHPTYRELAGLPLAERVARLRDPEVRARLLAEEPATKQVFAKTIITRWNQIFPLGDPPNYEPPPESSVAATARRLCVTPESLVLDWMLERDGTGFLFAPLTSYLAGDLEGIKAMMLHPLTVLSLSDGGADCGLICDASMATTLLTHWVRDRTRGERLPIEKVVHQQTARTARAYGFTDRGEIVAGQRADLNLVDLDGLRLHSPEMVFDLPAGGRRIVQHVEGYRATFVAGVQTYDDGEPTGARPGTLVRFGR